MIISTSASLRRPSWLRRTGGMTMPSWWTSVASGFQPPGALPPMSIQCPVLAMSAKSSPSTKTGATRLTSLRCVPAR